MKLILRVFSKMYKKNFEKCYSSPYFLYVKRESISKLHETEVVT